ncbi:MAG: NRDE family protein [Bacteroidia bacterium]|jgi:hypothetical protein|nr:NRDE family protein [Bacteroidia bacterium]MBP7244870.1 NRDE family protein [Bacteroidia bacterium]
MCTVTYLPLEKRGFILTSNRDEQTIRKSALPPSKYLLNNTAVFFPKDQQAGGTWIATAHQQFTLCLLNGAYVKHDRKEKYKWSRGQVLLDFFHYNDVSLFSKNYDFIDIEPFTLIIVEEKEIIRLYQLVWDGENIHLEKKNAEEENIWSSVTLYEPQVIEARKKWFTQWLEEHSLDRKNEISSFHRFGGDGNPESNVLMNRNNIVKTVSITSVYSSDDETTMQYFDVLTDQEYKIRIL